jgi:5-methylcytosine-specific restriction endonuclease McrA
MGYRSKVWSISDDRFIELVKSSNSMPEVLVKLGLRPAGGNFMTLKKRLLELNMLNDLAYRSKQYKQISVLDRHRKHFTLDYWLSVGTHIKTTDLKRKLFKAGIKKEECEICGIKNIWNDKILKLQIHHINGISTDNRIENLMIVCPNCHSQTDTFCGKSSNLIHDNVKVNVPCTVCGELKPINEHSTCRKCSFKKISKLNHWDSIIINKTLDEIKILGVKEFSEKNHISTTVVYKYLKRHETNKLPS